MKRNVFLLKVICLTLILATLASFIACDNGGVGESEKGSTPEINENDLPDDTNDKEEDKSEDSKENENGSSDSENNNETEDENNDNSNGVENGSSNNTNDDIENGENNEDKEEEAAEIKVYYKDDGSVDYEEHFNKDGVLIKKVEYSSASTQETFFAPDGKKIKQVLYYDGSIFVSELNEDEDIVKCTVQNEFINAYTVFEYDDNNNMIKEIVYNDKDEIISCLKFEYNEYGALIKETREVLSVFSAHIKHGTGKYIIEYEPDNANEKHQHSYVLFFLGFSTIKYEMYIDTNTRTERFNFKIVTSYVYYRENGNIGEQYIREYDGNGSYITRRTVYKEDGSLHYDEIYDKDGKRIEYIPYT